MNTRSPRVWLIDIREEIAGIQGLTKEADLAAFSASWAMKRAVEHALLIIAEAAKNLPQSMKEARPEVPWQQIKTQDQRRAHAICGVRGCRYRRR